MQFTGTYTAIVTPFKNGQIDEPALERLIKHQIKGGVDGIVPVGTTGESATLDYEEHLRVIALAVKFAHGKIKVMAGTGANSTKEAIYLTQEAERLGADRQCHRHQPRLSGCRHDRRRVRVRLSGHRQAHGRFRAPQGHTGGAGLRPDLRRDLHRLELGGRYRVDRHQSAPAASPVTGVQRRTTS